MKLNVVPKMTCHLGVKNSEAKTKPTITRPLFIAPARNIMHIVTVTDLLRYMKIRETAVRATEIKKIHLRPILSAIRGMKRIVRDQPAKYILPIRPSLKLGVQTKSSCSTQLCRLVWLL